MTEYIANADIWFTADSWEDAVEYARTQLGSDVLLLEPVFAIEVGQPEEDE